MCSLEKIGDVFVLRFTGAIDEHRLNPTFCTEVVSHLTTVNNSDARALVTTNDGKFFSNGLDLAWVSQSPTTRSQPQSDAFKALLDAFMRVNVPTIAAICGHASAGGFILALAHDHRHMYSQRGFLYMSELDVKILIPERIMTLVRYKLDPRAFKEVVLRAKKIEGAVAKELGVVDGVYDTPEETFDAAITDAVQLGRKKWDKALYVSMRLAMYPGYVMNVQAKL